ncbi:Uncharacterized membrane protein YpjA [Halogranum amylolyticum]|uniref:Uncharacterized membrane protein YpjA n=1 Tax=Halogranum amylolyticum TaxID=660520 RepID=A0A1H8RKJ8_9EURY|nr:DUF1405 domain-containing protein [Halogranum amylolyticum]SEO66915.1 Uncharacterized membrane protein YpjA [Halogranum amylolyticum]
MDLSRLLSDHVVEEYLGSAPTLVWLLVVNATAFLVGIRFYVETMPSVPTFLWPLYGDSPTALALATLSLATLLPALEGRVLDSPINRPLAYLHTLSFVWLVKYGLWTFVALNLHPELYFGFDQQALYDYWFIIGTHLLFVVEAVAIARVGRTTRGALGFALVALLVNDVFDYWFGYHPPLRYAPGVVLPAVTVGLTLLAVGCAGSVFVPLARKTE